MNFILKYQEWEAGIVSLKPSGVSNGSQGGGPVVYNQV